MGKADSAGYRYHFVDKCHIAGTQYKTVSLRRLMVNGKSDRAFCVHWTGSDGIDLWQDKNDPGVILGGGSGRIYLYSAGRFNEKSPDSLLTIGVSEKLVNLLVLGGNRLVMMWRRK